VPGDVVSQPVRADAADDGRFRLEKLCRGGGAHERMNPDSRETGADGDEIGRTCLPATDRQAEAR